MVLGAMRHRSIYLAFCNAGGGVPAVDNQRGHVAVDDKAAQDETAHGRAYTRPTLLFGGDDICKESGIRALQAPRPGY